MRCNLPKEGATFVTGADYGDTALVDTPARERVVWLRRIRWGAFAGHLVVFALVVMGLGITLDPLPFAAVQLVLAGSNIALHRRRALAHPRHALLVGAVLCLDVCLLTAMLYAYGGYANPFSMMYLVHVVLAAFLLGGAGTWCIVLLAGLSYAALFLRHVPLPELAMHHHDHHAAASGFDLHLHGMLIAFVLISFLIAGFVSRMRLAIDRKEREISRMRSNEERLISLTRLAAGVAHEIGTPLATAMIVAGELNDTFERLEPDEAKRQIAIALRELERCKAILSRMRADGGITAEGAAVRCGVEEILARVRERFPGRNLNVSSRGGTYEIVIPVSSVLQALTALVDNAFDASPAGESVSLEIFRAGERLAFEVSDRGAGMDRLTLRQACEPFFTTKEPGKGTGLGLFLCRIFAEQLGGSLEIRSEPGRGTTATLILPQEGSWAAAA